MNEFISELGATRVGAAGDRKWQASTAPLDEWEVTVGGLLMLREADDGQIHMIDIATGEPAAA